MGNVNNEEFNREKPKIDEILTKYAGQEGSLIAVLQDTQELFNYLPKYVLIYISDQLGVPISDVYGVVTFYSQFHLNPRGRNIIRCCQGAACHVRGGKRILGTVEDVLGIKTGHTTEDQRFTLETIACLGACGMAPVMQINGETYGRLTPDDIPIILEHYK
ncbi:MAG: NADH-quinone oxidoreductase subunit NuoE [Megasphaera sp.]|jgi:NADH:ubiquinone oxidoreductase subunit E|nr:NADH-quinone oxidoreductase subunit NuoE [Megasphaera sp.]MCI1247852.1 NADH-quinone oxidoreductase subunit NuoE [Megasphaera sp.]